MINRLLGIIYVLMSKDTVTANALAERFEVSVRTIYRDIETLSMAGIPVYAKKGKNGGISLTRQFVLDKMLINEEEQQQILSALVSLREMGVLEEQKTLQKLEDFFMAESVDWLSIDLSAWGGERKVLYEDLKNAILTRKVISFDYYGQYGEMSRRTVEPMQLLFKEYTWYLKAYCRKRQAFRTFKLARMKRMEVLEEQFELRAEWYQRSAAKKGAVENARQMVKKPEPDQEDVQGLAASQESGPGKEKESKQDSRLPEILVWIDKKEAYRVYDRFDESELEVLEDGSFLVHLHYCTDEWLYSQIFYFGPYAKVIAPDDVKQEMQRRIQKMLQDYEK